MQNFSKKFKKDIKKNARNLRGLRYFEFGFKKVNNRNQEVLRGLKSFQ